MTKLTKGDLHFFLLKAHSLLGLVPIGLFLAFHLSFNTLRTVGVRQYQFGIDLINNLPMLHWIEFLFIFAPLLLHSLAGFYITLAGRPNVARYPYPRNWMYLLQRFTGGIVFVFLVFHVWTTVGAKAAAGKEMFAAAPFLIDIMNRQFADWSGRLVYLAGIFSAVFHFANGLWGFCMSWGLIVGRDAQRNAALLFLCVGIVLGALGVMSVVEFSLHPVPAKMALLE